MGRGVGNLATELITDYINNNLGQKYSLTPILNIVDKYIMPIYAQQRWGYDLPYFLSATYKCHPNYAAHLIRKETISIETIEKILSLIPSDSRNEYNSDLIENLYLKIQDFEIDDSEAYKKLECVINAKEVLMIGPGASILKYKDAIDQFIKGRMVIAANFIPESIQIDAFFISNEKRLDTLNLNNDRIVLATSNLSRKLKSTLMFNYSSLLGEGDASDNAGAMLVRLLKKCGVKKIVLAGFDGFDVDSLSNYAVSTFKKSLDFDMAKKKNEDISKQFSLALSGVDYEFITPTKYKISDI